MHNPLFYYALVYVSSAVGQCEVEERGCSHLSTTSWFIQPNLLVSNSVSSIYAGKRDLILNVLNIVYNNISVCISTDTHDTLHCNKNFQAGEHGRTLSFMEGRDK